ncbi:hypothetical protein MHB50_16795 [Siminovitchia sp. FSL H7-0308]|jgi:hypothetical protein|uniref:hypothetical protein n=1 Tax=unclassified Siminovitchia TaxID=2837530 RepID=UPI0030D44A06
MMIAKAGEAGVDPAKSGTAISKTVPSPIFRKSIRVRVELRWEMERKKALVKGLFIDVLHTIFPKDVGGIYRGEMD